jgi:hypothetical protein
MYAFENGSYIGIGSGERIRWMVQADKDLPLPEGTQGFGMERHISSFGSSNCPGCVQKLHFVFPKENISYRSVSVPKFKMALCI